ncbi:helix-turn-helix transcriptional regulator [Comamonas sp.]|uniref:helix-turn-helix domain-containing protein n=1 Tax=Comamonas sp. TaxID=34028 RepID=UPI002899462B|nr:helix-turn-helix transcriptional regulator [Comamonas sp.]
MDEFIVHTSRQLPIFLSAFRKTAKLTQADVAVRMGVTQQTISAMERNANAVSAERLMKLLSVLGVDLVLRSHPEPSDYAGSELRSLDDW